MMPQSNARAMVRPAEPWDVALRLHAVALGLALATVVATGLAMRGVLAWSTVDQLTMADRASFQTLRSVHILVARYGLVGPLAGAALVFLARCHRRPGPGARIAAVAGVVHLVTVAAFVVGSGLDSEVGLALGVGGIAASAIGGFAALVAFTQTAHGRRDVWRDELALAAGLSAIVWLVLVLRPMVTLVLALSSSGTREAVARANPDFMDLNQLQPYLVALPLVLGLGLRLWRPRVPRAVGWSTVVLGLGFLLAPHLESSFPSATWRESYLAPSVSHLTLGSVVLLAALAMALPQRVSWWEPAVVVALAAVPPILESALAIHGMPSGYAEFDPDFRLLHGALTVAWCASLAFTSWVLVRWWRRPRWMWPRDDEGAATRAFD